MSDVFIERRNNGNWYIIADETDYPCLAVKATLDEATDWCIEREFEVIDIRM